MVVDGKSINVLIREYLIKQKCLEAAAHFTQEIGLEVDNITIYTDYTLEEIFEQHESKILSENNAVKKRKIVNDSSIAGEKADDDPCSEIDHSDADCDKSDETVNSSNVLTEMLPLPNEMSSSDLIQVYTLSHRKKIDLLPLLQESKKHFKDLTTIPRNFSVPYDDNWSHKYHGICLGKLIHSGNKKQKTSGSRPATGASRKDQIVFAYQLFVAKYGHGDVPILFSIKDNDEDWPVEVRGLNLGRVLGGVRLGLHKEIHQQLADLGFSFKLQRKTLAAEQLYELLVIYKRLHGDCIDIKSRFVVPESPDYPQYAWHFELGRCVNDKIKKGSYPQLRDKWEELGIALNKNFVLSKSTKDVTIDEMCEAIECYKAIHGHLDAANSYLVPADSTFPSHLHGIRLGKILYDMRHAGSYAQHKDRLAQLGVVVARRANESMRGTGKVL